MLALLVFMISAVGDATFSEFTIFLIYTIISQIVNKFRQDYIFMITFQLNPPFSYEFDFEINKEGPLTKKTELVF
jgi:hypothetical protein